MTLYVSTFHISSLTTGLISRSTYIYKDTVSTPHPSHKGLLKILTNSQKFPCKPLYPFQLNIANFHATTNNSGIFSKFLENSREEILLRSTPSTKRFSKIFKVFRKIWSFNENFGKLQKIILEAPVIF